MSDDSHAVENSRDEAKAASIPGPDPGACPKCGEWVKAGMRHTCKAASVNVSEAAWALRVGWPEPARALRYWIAFKVEDDTEREFLLGKLDELMKEHRGA